VIAVAALIWDVAYHFSAHFTGDQMRWMASILFANSQFRILLVQGADSTARELYVEEVLPEQHQHLSAPISAVGVGLFYLS